MTERNKNTNNQRSVLTKSYEHVSMRLCEDPQCFQKVSTTYNCCPISQSQSSLNIACSAYQWWALWSRPSKRRRFRGGDNKDWNIESILVYLVCGRAAAVATIQPDTPELRWSALSLECHSAVTTRVGDKHDYLTSRQLVFLQKLLPTQSLFDFYLGVLAFSTVLTRFSCSSSNGNDRENLFEAQLLVVVIKSDCLAR